MKNNKNLFYIIIAIAILVISTVAFVIPFNKTIPFLISYIFTIIALGTLTTVFKVTFNNKNAKSKFGSLSVIYICVVYVVCQIVVLVLFSIIPKVPIWTSVIVNILIFSIAVICIVLTNMGLKKAEQSECEIKTRTSFIKELGYEIELLADKEKDSAIKSELNKVVEKIRFSDPVSNDEIAEIEKQIKKSLNEFNKSENKIESIRRINLLINERNIKIKALK